MKTFEEVMEVTGKISSHTAFEDAECRLFYELLTGLPEGAGVLEVGCQFGRSSSIILQAAPKDAELHFVDPFEDPETAAGWLRMARGIGRKLVLHMGKTEEMITNLPFPDFVLIDGDHTAEGVGTDCKLILPDCCRGALACFHDYGRDSLPDVIATVERYMDDHKEWSFYKQAGTLGVWRKS